MTSQRSLVTRLAIFSFAVAVSFVLGACKDTTTTTPANTDIVNGVWKPASTPYGKTYKQWQAAWWMWMYGTPATNASNTIVHPIFDSTGTMTNPWLNQDTTGSVLFLGGVFNTSGIANRTITVPSGKALFFPVLNAALDNAGVPDSSKVSDDSLRINDSLAMNDAANIRAEIDGVTIQGMDTYRTQSAAFSYTLPDYNVYDFFGIPIAAGTVVSPVYDSGYYLMVAPLGKGAHVLHWHGENPTGPFTLDITYHLTVQ